MHEMSLVQGLFDQLKELARQNNVNKVLRVTMEIGPLSGVVIDSFQFGFDALSEDDPMFTEAVLEIEIPLVTYRCPSCSHEITTSAERPEKCEQCQEPILIPSGGDDLILKQVEME